MVNHEIGSRELASWVEQNLEDRTTSNKRSHDSGRALPTLVMSLSICLNAFSNFILLNKSKSK